MRLDTNSRCDDPNDRTARLNPSFQKVRAAGTQRRVLASAQLKRILTMSLYWRGREWIARVKDQHLPDYLDHKLGRA